MVLRHTTRKREARSGVQAARRPTLSESRALLPGVRDAKALDTARKNVEQAAIATHDPLATVVHELRAPLTGILGHVELACRDGELSEAQRWRFEQIRKAGESLLLIVDDLLDLEKSENAELRLNATTCDLHELVATSCDILRPSAQARHIDVKQTLVCASPIRLIDGGRFKQVVLNLLGNAIKFTDEGSVAVTLRDLDAATVLLSVTDSGIGIPQEGREMVFDRFVQLGTSDQRRRGGSGLGLAITKAIVRSMGGEISYAPNPQGGSVFTVELKPPRSRVAAGQAACDSKRREAAVLVVDDNTMARDLAAELLRAHRCRVDTAGNGTEALAMVQTQRYDIAFIDDRMPDMSGRTAARLMKESRLAPSQIVHCSATAMVERAPGETFLQKPITACDVEALLDKVADDADQMPAACGLRFDLSTPAQHGRTIQHELEELAGAITLGKYTDAANLAHKLISSAVAIDCVGAAQVLTDLEDALRRGTSTQSSVQAAIRSAISHIADITEKEAGQCQRP